MNSVIDILELLESDNSRNFKEDVLRKNRGNDLLRRVFISAGDPYINFFVNKFRMPLPAATSATEDGTVKTFLDEIHGKLSTRDVTGNDAKALVTDLFKRMTAREQKWCLRILLRNLRVGVLETTVNKVWPNAISKFSVQLAESLGSRHEADKGIVITDKVSYPVRVEPKLDGLRCIAVKKDGVVKMFTRSGSTIETLPTVKAALEAADYGDYVLDGEIMGENWNDTASVVMSYKTAKDDSSMIYNVFDALSFEDWKKQKNADALRLRIEVAAEIVNKVGSKHVVQVSGQEVKNQKEMMKFYSQTMEKGYEGIMLKNLDSSYAFKRSDAVLKLKPVSTYEGVVVGHYEGNRGSKREGLWGGFQVLMPNGIITRVGGGYTDALKAEIDINPDAWIGKVLEVEGQPDPATADGLSKDGKVRFPVFVRVRAQQDVDQKVLDAYEAYKNSSS